MKTVFVMIMAAALALLCACEDTQEPADVTSGAETVSEPVDEEYEETDVEKAALAAFSASSVDGDTYTGDIFSEYDITMVNVWATWCPPCVAELPDLAVVYNQKPSNANMISICIDAGESEDTALLAKNMVADAGGEFQILIPDQVLNEELLSGITAI
nr:TlpA family protein disulfide reductase [Clostridiales bacterium]